MEPANATNTNRKSGEAEGPAVRLSSTQLPSWDSLHPSVTAVEVSAAPLCHPRAKLVGKWNVLALSFRVVSDRDRGK